MRHDQRSTRRAFAATQKVDAQSNVPAARKPDIETTSRNTWEADVAYKFEVYKDKAGEFRFRFKAPNGETMFGSEGYKGKASALSAIESIKKNAPGAATDDKS
jgi:uncharacterized protein YegP (UPF0339 family)